MKYMVTWNERPQGSALEYERAQKRILEIFRSWDRPESFEIEMFVIRVGDWGGYMLADCENPVEIHKMCSMNPALEFQVRPVMVAEEAMQSEIEMMAWREGLKFD